jgi:uncharacterized protein YggE
VEKGYELMHTLKATSDVRGVGDIVKAAVGAGATGIDRIEYVVSRDAKDVAVAQAMQEATLTARKKARTVASSVGAHVGRPLKIEEGGWWVTTSSEPLDTSDIPPEYQGNVITPQRLAVQANVNAVFRVWSW